MASSWTPGDDNRPYTGRRAIQNRILLDPIIYAPHQDSQALSQRADNEAKTWNQHANFMECEIDQAEGDIQALKRALEVAEARYSRLSRRLYKLRDFDPRIHRIVSRGFVKRAEEAQNKIESLEKELSKKTNEHESIVSLWQEALRELEETKSSKKSLTVDDDAMTSGWKQLQFIIRNISIWCFYGLGTSSTGILTDRDLGRYRQLMPMSSRLPTEYSTMKLFAAINKDRQNGDKIPASDFHAFRAQTGQIITTSMNVDLTICDNLKAELKAQLQLFTSPEEAQEVHRQLDNIIDKAVDLAMLFLRARCYYYLGRMNRSSELRFNTNTMEDVDGNEGEDRMVLSIISPALFKDGNSKGENYEESIMLAKPVVWCGEMA
ncbi:hypothetical protein FHL15_010841 [Xylaria flabelliformis]|uniref:Uncharacterized protein n=1 Tax=Xylaria flabelliformis TaxID=2512241 RepID=A0A553HJZ6_9PEZI|nr:hypothetical protein FHL15_010841 [Xylaria flabelliformis]